MKTHDYTCNCRLIKTRVEPLIPTEILNLSIKLEVLMRFATYLGRTLLYDSSGQHADIQVGSKVACKIAMTPACW